jgi:hypothetical protein
VQTISFSDDEREEHKFHREVRAPIGEARKFEQEIKSPNATKLAKQGETKNAKELTSNGRHDMFSTLSATTSRITLKPSATLDKLETLLEKVKWTSSRGRRQSLQRTVSCYS